MSDPYESDDCAYVNTNLFLFRYAGGYTICGCFTISIRKKPCWFHRIMMRLCLGWVWHDTEESNPSDQRANKETPHGNGEKK